MITIEVHDEFRAQFGEDRLLWSLFRQRPHGYFIEIGAYDGVQLSNTCFLESKGWSGLLVEPIPQLAQLAANARPRSEVFATACGAPTSPPVSTFTIANNVPVLSFLKADQDHIDRCLREGAQLVEIQVPVRTVDSLLIETRRQLINRASRSPSEGGNPQHGIWQAGKGWSIDVVTIDTEGSELDVLEGFNLERFRPRILIMENDRDAGATIQPYLDQRGYRRFHRQVINDFYIRKDDAAEDLDLEGMAQLARTLNPSSANPG
ncbi:MAG: FkbM family methyltransferase [Phycisphaerae bacterium]